MTIGEIQKAPRTKLAVQLCARDGIRYINIREWYVKKSENVWRPATGGFAIRLDIHTEYSPAHNLLKLLTIAVNESEAFALEGNPVYTDK